MQRAPLFLEENTMDVLKGVLPDTWESYLMMALTEGKKKGSTQAIFDKVEQGDTTRALRLCVLAHKVIQPQGQDAVDLFKTHKMCFQGLDRVHELLDLCITATRLDLQKAQIGAKCLFHSRITHADVQCKSVAFVGANGQRVYAVMYEKYAEFFQMLWMVVQIPRIVLECAKEWVKSHSDWDYDAFKSSEDMKLLYTNYNHTLTFLRLWWAEFDGIVVC